MEDKNEQTASLDLQVVTAKKKKTSECWIFDNSLKDDLNLDNIQVKLHKVVLHNLVVWRKLELY